MFVDEAVPLTAPILRLFFGRRVAFTLHDFFVDIYLEPKPLLRPAGRFIKWIDRSAWRTLPLILCRVEAAKRRLVSAGFDPARIVVACDPCDLALFSPGDRAAARRELDLPPGAFILVHHGVMHPNKGNDRLVRAAARLRETLPDLLLLLVGDSPAMGGLRKLCVELGCESSVRFTGWVPDIATVSDAYQASDAAVALRIGQPGDHFHVTSTLAHNLATGLHAGRAPGGFRRDRAGRPERPALRPAVGDEFDAALTRLHADARLRDELAANGRRTALRLFDVERVAATMAGARCGQ
ncbi:MAG: glycosyltransferase [Kiritimatiellia bacterium]